MLRLVAFACLVSAVVVAVPLVHDDEVPIPEQVKLALAETADTLSVTWVLPTVKLNGTEERPSDAYCIYGPVGGPVKNTLSTRVWSYTAGGFAGSIFQAFLTGIAPDEVISYRCGGGGGTTAFSKEYKFRAGPAPMSERTITVGSYGDMGRAMPKQHLLGHDSSNTQKALNDDALAGKFDLVINVGDSSYANKYKQPNSHIYDEFWREMEPVAASAPHMICAGNHEREFNFAPHLARIRMPLKGSGPLARFYTSFDFGPMHVVQFSTEPEHPLKGEQYDFIKADLAKVNRTLTPWVVAFSHHAMYCTDALTEEPRCIRDASRYRAVLEDLFRDAGVDVFLSGHNHQYERSWPVYNNTVTSKDLNHPNKGTVYIVNGAAGTVEGTEPGFIPFAKIRAYGRNLFNTGYARFSVNRTSFDWEYVDTSGIMKNKVIDRFSMKKSSTVSL